VLNSGRYKTISKALKIGLISFELHTAQSSRLAATQDMSFCDTLLLGRFFIDLKISKNGPYFIKKLTLLT